MYIPCEASSWTLLHQNRKLPSRISLQNDCSACADYQPWYTHPDIQSLHHLPRPNCGDYLDMRGISEGKLIRILENTEFMLNMWLDCSKCLKLLGLCIDTTETKWGGLCLCANLCARRSLLLFDPWCILKVRSVFKNKWTQGRVRN